MCNKAREDGTGMHDDIATAESEVRDGVMAELQEVRFGSWGNCLWNLRDRGRECNGAGAPRSKEKPEVVVREGGVEAGFPKRPIIYY